MTNASFKIFIGPSLADNFNMAKIIAKAKVEALDVKAAIKMLKELPWYDPSRMYIIQEKRADGALIGHAVDAEVSDLDEYKERVLPFDVNDPLPNVLSDLILVALNDLEAVKGIDGMGINMNQWVDVDNCTVCLAGAVLVNTMGMSLIDIKAVIDDIKAVIDDNTDVSHSVWNKIRIIDYIREGEIDEALTLAVNAGMVYKHSPDKQIAIPKAIRFSDVNVYHYGNNSSGFMENIRNIAHDLVLLGY